MSDKMADAEAEGERQESAAPGCNRVRIKPTIYKTTKGEIIVEDEFLNFLAVKMKTMSQEELVLLASNNFDSEWIQTSKKVLFELCPGTKQRCVAHKGSMKDANNVKSCLKILNECGEKIPRFVSHYLDELPPVSFNNLDISNLLSKMERLHSEVCALRCTVKLQADVEEDLRAVASSMDCRVAALERRLEPGRGGENGLELPRDPGSADSSRAKTRHAAVDKGERVAASAGVPASLAAADSYIFPVPAACTEINPGGGTGPSAEACTTRPPAGSTVAVENSPKWSQVAERGKHRRMRSLQQGQPSLSKRRHGQPDRRITYKPIVGTGAQGNIKVVRTKLVSVFAIKFAPDLDAVTLSNYVRNKLGHDVTCERIATERNRFSSFKVSAECNEVAEMYNPDV